MYIPTNCDATLLASQASSGRRPTSLLSLPFSFMCVRHGPCLLTEEKKIHTLEVKCVRKLLRMLSLENKTNDGVEQNQLPCGPQEPLLATVKRRKLAWFGHLTHHDSLSTSFMAPWRAGNATVGRRNDGWTTSKSGHPWLCQNCSRGPPVQKTGRGSLLNRPPCLLDDPICRGTELN